MADDRGRLEIRGLRKTFDPGLLQRSVDVLRGVEFTVERGEVFGFLGPNGAGKTTTIKCMTGLVRPDEGEIRISGLEHTSAEARSRYGFMAESPYLYPHLTGREMLAFTAELLGLDRAEIGRRIERVLDRVGMSERSDAPMRTYSKGMLQRISLGRALLGEPEILILDEPMSGLDPVGRRDVRDLILAERDRGTTVFFSSHVIPDVEVVCDRIAVIAEGVVRSTGTVRELLVREADEYEVTFSGVDPLSLETPVSPVRGERGEVAWMRLSAKRRDDLLAELERRGGRLIALTPVRTTLEDFILREVEGRAP